MARATRDFSGRLKFEPFESPLVSVDGNIFGQIPGYFAVGYRALYQTIASRACHPTTSFLMKENAISDEGFDEIDTDLVVDQHRIVEFTENYPKSTLDHILWAAENEDWNFQILKIVFVNEFEVIAKGLKEIYNDHDENQKSAATYRRIWCLFELITGQEVDIPDLNQETAAFLYLDPVYYVTGPCYGMSRRQRIFVNLTGNFGFLPIARKTKFTAHAQKAHNSISISKVTAQSDGNLEFSKSQLERVANYLRQLETRATFQIEGEEDQFDECKAWLDALVNIDRLPLGTAAGIQNLAKILKINPTTSNHGWRDHEIYIASSQRMKTVGAEDVVTDIIHHIGAAKDDLDEIMNGFLQLMNDVIKFSRMKSFEFADPLLKYNRKEFDLISLAGILTFGFTLIHPLSDGNGRVHRLLVHYILEKSGYCKTMVFPISPIIMKDNETTKRKDKLLKSFSDQILERIRYSASNVGEITILNRTDVYYQNFDGTRIAEYMHYLVEMTIVEFKAELAFVAAYDDITAELQFKDNEVDMKNVRRFLVKAFELLRKSSTNKSFSKKTQKDFLNKRNWSLEQIERAGEITLKYFLVTKSSPNNLQAPPMNILHKHQKHDSGYKSGGEEDKEDVFHFLEKDMEKMLSFEV